MKTKDFAIRFLITFGTGLITAILVTLCWNYFIKGNGPIRTRITKVQICDLSKEIIKKLLATRKIANAKKALTVNTG